MQVLNCKPWHKSNDANKCLKMLLNVDYNAKIVIESDLCTNVRFFGLMNVSSHWRSPFDANDCAKGVSSTRKILERRKTFRWV